VCELVHEHDEVEFKSRVVVFRFRYISGKLCDKQGVMC